MLALALEETLLQFQHHKPACVVLFQSPPTRAYKQPITHELTHTKSLVLIFSPKQVGGKD